MSRGTLTQTGLPIFAYLEEWEVPAELLTGASTLLLFLSTLLLVLYAYFQLREAARSSNRSHRHQTSQDCLTALTKAGSRLAKAQRQFRQSEAQTAVDGDKELQQKECENARQRVLDELEDVAIQVNASTIDIGVANAFFGSFIEKIYQVHAQQIRGKRRTNPRYYRQLEMMIDDLHAFRRSQFQITRRELKRLASKLEDPAVLPKLTDVFFPGRVTLAGRVRCWAASLRRWLGVWLQPPAPAAVGAAARAGESNTFTYEELERRLHQAGVHDDIYLVVKHARRKHPRMEEKPQESRSFLIETFEAMYHATEGRYPFGMDGQLSMERFLDAIPTPAHCRRWFAVNSLENGRRQILGHISCIDLSQDTSQEWVAVFEELKKYDPEIKKDEFFVIQEPYVVATSKRLGLARMLIRHVIGVMEEEEFPRLPPTHNRRLALGIVKHSDFNEFYKWVYCRDGGVPFRRDNLPFIQVPIPTLCTPKITDVAFLTLSKSTTRTSRAGRETEKQA